MQGLKKWLTLVCASLVATCAIAAGEPTPVPTLAIKGYDPVAYFADGKATAGREEFSTTHDGQQYRFASAANRDRFLTHPTKYAPQYGGYCAFGATRGYKSAIDPASFTIREGKLYLNYSPKVQTMWEKDIPGFIKQADEKWPETQKTTKRRFQEISATPAQLWLPTPRLVFSSPGTLAVDC